jgi:hypothetical protein
MGMGYYPVGRLIFLNLNEFRMGFIFKAQLLHVSNFPATVTIFFRFDENARNGTAIRKKGSVFRKVPKD